MFSAYMHIRATEETKLWVGSRQNWDGDDMKNGEHIAYERLLEGVLTTSSHQSLSILTHFTLGVLGSMIC